MNEKIISEQAYQAGSTVVTPDYIFPKARLAVFEDHNYAVNPYALFTVNCTAECNARCFFCYNGITFMRSDGYCAADAPELERAVRFALAAGITTASLSGGEPTICPHKLLALVRRLKALGMQTVRLHTNGLMLGRPVAVDGVTRPLWQWLAELGLDEMSISIAHHSAEKNRAIMQVENLGAVRQILPALLQTGIRVRFSCYLCGQGVDTIAEQQEYLNAANALGVNNVIFRKAPAVREEDLRYLDDMTAALAAAGWQQDYRHEKSDSLIATFSQGERQVFFSCVSEEPDPDAKIRRLIYMPDRVVYTSWIDPASFLFADDAGRVAEGLQTERRAAVPAFVHRDHGQTIDLHLHSRISDGWNAPSEVIRNAAAAGITTMVFAEHNCLHDAADELPALAERFGVRIPFLGAEMNTVYCENGRPKLKFHLLLYGKRQENFAFLKGLHDPNEARNRHLREQYRQAREQNLLVRPWSELFAVNDPLLYGEKKMFLRTPIAQAIADHTGIPVQQAKDQYLPKLTSGEVYGLYLDTAELIALAHRNGCVAVLAHPGWIRPFAEGQTADEKDLFEAIAQLARAGLDGIEISHRQNSPQMREKLFRLADGLGLIPTGGSDYHGKPRCVLGVHGTAEEHFAALAARLEELL